MSKEQRSGSILIALVNLINGELSRRATARLEDRRQQFQKEQGEQQKNFQREQFEKQKKLQLKLAAENRKTQLELAAEQRKTALQLEQARQVFANWPLRTKAPADILMKYQDDELIPLRLILAPPIVDYDKYGTLSKNFPPLELGLAEGLRKFLGSQKHYPAHSLERPIVLLDGVWDSKRYHGGGTIELLHDWIKSEPILILESVVDGNYLNLRVGYWGQGQERYSYESIISELPYWEIIYESVKTRALKWKETRDKLLALGKSPEEINRLGGDNAFNLRLLEEEEELRKLGVDTTTLAIQKQYKIDGEKDIKYLSQFLVTCHCLVAGWMADVHYLIYKRVPPLLPQLLPDLTKDFREPKLLEEIVLGYQKVYQALENERPAWVPELSLELADSIKYLPDKTWARKQVDNSIKSWLKMRGVTPEEGTNLIETMKSLLEPEDWKYLENIGNCFAEVGDYEAAAQVEEIINNKAQAYYNRGIALADQKKYKEAIADYHEAISLDDKFAAAYYHKGLAHAKLKQYQDALNSYKVGLEKCGQYSCEEAQGFQTKNDEEAWFYLGWALTKLENLGEETAWEEAKKSFDRVREINSNYYPISDSKAREIWHRFLEESGADIPLISVRGIDYTRLRDLLAKEDWKAANRETFRCMEKAINYRNLTRSLITKVPNNKFPNNDFFTIDKLWIKYSGGRFGFSVQKELWNREIGHSRLDYKVPELEGYSSDDKKLKRKEIGFSLLVGWCIQEFYDEEYGLEQMNYDIEEEECEKTEILQAIDRSDRSKGKLVLFWYDDYSADFSLSAPKGHLPIYPDDSRKRWLFFRRLMESHVFED